MSGATATASAGRTRRRPRRQGGAAPYVLLLPALVLLVVFLLIPIGYTVYLSLRASRVTGGGLGLRKETFVGFANYVGAISDSAYLHSIVRMIGYGIIVVPTMLGLALLFALLLDSQGARFKTFTRLGIFLPYAVPGVIASLLWGFLYLPGVSPIRDAITAVGLPAPDFLGPGKVLFSVANIGIWGGVGFNMIVLYTALRGLPAELDDAARVDGASELQIALRIKVPLIAPALVMTGIFSLISSLQVFSEPSTLQPLTDSISFTWVPLMTIYRDAFVNNDIYTAAAASVLLALGTLAVSLAVLSFLQKRAFGEDK